MIVFPDNTIKLSQKKTLNFIKVNGKDYQLKYLNDKLETNKGGNSNIFSLYNLQDDTDDLVIKFCKVNENVIKHSKRSRRFWREIYALKKIRSENLNKVINLIFYGKMEIEDEEKKQYRYSFFVTEKAECDLTDFILQGKLKGDLSAKVQLCRDLIDSIKQLHDLGIYHRDIKPENILFFKDGIWKICDLGLMTYRKEENQIDSTNEMIGPRGWLSPESINKYYTFERDTEYEFDCKIDEKSDIFQLGKVFWFIFQTNVPIGRIQRNDFRVKDDAIYSLLIWMLNYNKAKRINNIDSLKTEFHKITYRKYA